MTLRAAALLIVMGISIPISAAALPCRSDEVQSRTIPREAAWKKGERITNPPNVLRGWVKLALGFDWRAMNTPGFSITLYSAPAGYDAAFFITRKDAGWCGSGGCSLDLYFCKDGKCENEWNGFDGEIFFPGTLSGGRADFVIDGTDLYTFDRGEFRAVCNVTTE